jgi:two-component system, chemotaxis family, chemotaxis protein CheY
MLEGPEFKILGFASDGEEAVEIFKQFAEKPQIILMDHRMPKKNGVDATREILASTKSPKIIFTSADTSIKDAARSSGAVDFLKKPFKREDLIKSIEAALK